MLKKWKTLSYENKQNLKIFDFVVATRENDEGTKKSDFSIIRSDNWVNIIPITKDGKVVFVKQYRHGTDKIELEIPGGLIENGETPGEAAKRECIEETGYESENAIEFLGESSPNPAFLTNSCYTFLWEACEKKYPQNLDQLEEIEIIELDLKDLEKLVLTGRLKHGVILNAVLFYLLRKKK